MSDSQQSTTSTLTPVRASQSDSGKRLRYVYLASAPHSGSTLLACLLGAHPDISTVGEFGATFRPSLRCSCGADSVESCDFWKSWQERAHRKGIDFEFGNLGIDLDPSDGTSFLQRLHFHLFPLKTIDRLRDICLLPCTQLRRDSRNAIDKSIELARDLCEQEGTSTFLDTTKNSLQIPFLAGRRDVDVKLIALIRDGRGVTNSLLTKEKWSTDKSVGTWLWCNRNLQRAARYLPLDNVFLVRLEDLCREPEDTTRKLLEFCGVDSAQSPDCSQLENRHIIGNGMRIKFRGEIRLDEKWRQALSAENQAYFEERAGRLNRKLGYTD